MKKNTLSETKHPVDVSSGREQRSFPAEGGKAGGFPGVTPAAPLVQFGCFWNAHPSETRGFAERAGCSSPVGVGLSSTVPALRQRRMAASTGRSVFLSLEDAFLNQEEGCGGTRRWHSMNGIES